MMEFLKEIKSNVKEKSNSVSPSVSSTTPTASVTNNKTEIEFSAMINILIMHAQSHHVTLQVHKFEFYIFSKIHFSGIYVIFQSNIVSKFNERYFSDNGGSVDS